MSGLTHSTPCRARRFPRLRDFSSFFSHTVCQSLVLTNWQHPVCAMTSHRPSGLNCTMPSMGSTFFTGWPVVASNTMVPSPPAVPQASQRLSGLKERVPLPRVLLEARAVVLYLPLAGANAVYR